MRLSCPFVKIWRLKDNGVTNLTFLGSRDVIDHVTIRLPGVDFLSVVHGDHAPIWHRYGDMAPQMLDARTLARKERKKKGKRKRKRKEKEKKGKVEGKKKGKGKEKVRGEKGKWKVMERRR